jgi:hypothetical protein
MIAKTRLMVVATVCLLALSALPVYAAAPGNDDQANAIVINTIPYSNTQDTSEATTDDDDPWCSGQGPTVWYSFTPSEDIRLEANTFGSDYDTTLLAAVDDGAGGLDVLRCNDDAGDDLQSRIRFEAEAGVTYLFMVGAYDSGPGGELVFNLLEAPPGQDVSVSLDVAGARFNSDGSATVHGTVSCSGSDWVELYAELSQQVGRFRINGWGWDFVDCSPDATPFELHIRSYDGSFAGGPASVYVEAWTCGDDDCAFDVVETTIRLRR